MGEKREADSAVREMTYREVLVVLAGLLLGMLLSGLDQTIVSTAARTVGDDLGDLTGIAWVTTSFLITSTISSLIYGKLADLFGRKHLYMVAITIFLVGSLLCGLATSVPMLAVFRALQGLGAGGLMSLAFAITGVIIPPRDRAKYQGYFAATMALSSVLGPLVGGFFADWAGIGDLTGWRFAFWVNIPIGIAALIVIGRTLHIDQAAVARRLDYLGAALLTVAVVPLLLVGEQGASWGWGSVAAITCYVIGGASTALFIDRQRRIKDDALLPLRLFRTRHVSIPMLVMFVTGAVQIGVLTILPLYLQIVRSATPTQSGLLLIPMVLGISITSIVVGRLIRRTGRTKIFPVLGAIVQTIALAGLVTVTDQTSLLEVDIYMFLIGAGLGASANTIILMLQNAVPLSDLGVATGSSTFFRNIGATAGTASLVTILFTTANTAITHAYTAAHATPAYIAALTQHPEQADILKAGLPGGLQDTSFLTGLSPALAEPFKNGFTTAMNLTALVAALVAAAGFVLTLFIREIPLRTTSARVAAQTATSAAAADAG